MSTEVRCLEYEVSPDGRVSTDGNYRIVSQADWDHLYQPKQQRRTKYAAIMEQVRAGRIVAVETAKAKSAWSIAKTLRLRALREDTAIELKWGTDPGCPEQQVVMVRRVPD